MTKDANQSADTITRRVSVAIIGAGTAGQNAYRQARKSTENIVIINDGFWTTTCATIGCMPSKLIIAAAARAHDAKHSDNFGIHADVSINGAQVMTRVRAERDHFVSYVTEQVNSWPESHKISGRAHINARGHIAVNDELIEADKIIVATGSTPFIPDGWADNLGDTLLTSDTVFDLDDLPATMAVIGAGSIGLELAQAFARLGVDVTLFNHVNRVGGLQDDDINEKAMSCLARELTLQLGSRIDSVDTQTDADNGTVAIIHYQDHNDCAQHWKGDYVLVATGRRNNIKTLGIENLGVSLDEKNRPTPLNKNTGQIADLGVYIIGDANAHLPLLHVASDEGFSAGYAVTGDHTNTYLRPPSIPLSIVFCDPQIANVGMSLQEINNAEQPHVIGEVSFDNQGRSRIMGVNCGLLHIYACKETDKILGASMVAPDAEYIAHILAVAISNELSIKTLLETPFYHPTILEGLRSALRDAQDKLDIRHQN